MLGNYAAWDDLGHWAAIYMHLSGWGKTHGYGRTFRFAQELSIIIIAYAKIESLQSLIHI